MKPCGKSRIPLVSPILSKEEKLMAIPSITIFQNKITGIRQCPWHRRHPKGKIFRHQEIFPSHCCPWLYNALYPYFLGLQYGAKFTHNKEGDCHAGCPAPKGVDVIVRKRPYRNGFDPRITDHRPVIFAEVVAADKHCPYGHKKGQLILYPLCMNQYYLCPAGFHNVFPFFNLKPPSCINKHKLRCPDWRDTIYFNIGFRRKPLKQH
jgi:hypothetical protein